MNAVKTLKGCGFVIGERESILIVVCRLTPQTIPSPKRDSDHVASNHSKETIVSKSQFRFYTKETNRYLSSRLDRFGLKSSPVLKNFTDLRSVLVNTTSIIDLLERLAWHTSTHVC